MAEELQIIDDIEPSIFSSFTNIAISNFISHEAVRLYYDIYKTNWIPETFFEFAFDEYKKYAFLLSEDIKSFFRIYSNENISSIIQNYMNCDFTVLNKKRTRSGETVYHIDTSLESLKLSFGDDEVFGTSDKKLYGSLNNMANHFNSGDELVSKKDLYERFLMKKYLLEANSAKLSKIVKSNSTAEPPIATGPAKKINNDEMLVGEKTEVPNQKGKVVRMFFPKLTLPSTYPISQEKSRVNTERTVKKFMKIDNQVTLINRYKFNGVKYKLAFINKRKTAQKPAQKKKFEFDF